MKSVQIRISGRVQGVFFRASAKEIADQFGIKGFVRNESNGCVYIEAEADEVLIDRFVEWCHHGPARARVASVEIVEGEVKKFKGFEIQR